MTLLLVAVNLQSFFIFEPQINTQGRKSCKLVRVPENYQMVYNQIEHTLYSFGPFTVMILANGAIIYKFMRASCTRDQGGTESTNQALSKSANRGTTMLVAISLAFIVLTGPVAITLAITNDFGPMLQAVIVLVRYVNHSINAVLYCASGSRFRTELMKMYPFPYLQQQQKFWPELPQAFSISYHEQFGHQLYNHRRSGLNCKPHIVYDTEKGRVSCSRVNVVSYVDIFFVTILHTISSHRQHSPLSH